MKNRRRNSYSDRRDWMNTVIIIEIILLLVVLIVAGIFLGRSFLEKKGMKFSDLFKKNDTVETVVPTEPESQVETETEAETSDGGNADGTSSFNDGKPVRNVDPRTPDYFETEPEWERTLQSTGDALLDEANAIAAGYDYDKAIEMLQSSDSYASNTAYQNAVSEYETAKGQLVKWTDMTSITHIFFHALVVDAEAAFSSEKADDYNDVMTTTDEFCKIIQMMYDEGYVLVGLYDVAKMETQADGTQVMTWQEIWLPEGKKPFILSEDDVSYYEYMTGHGFANRFVIDEETGKVINEMDLEDGTVLRGAYDVVPILEDFIEAHPDFSYHGARGTLAMTGYDGLFGYRTSDFWYAEECDYYISNEKNDRDKVTQHTSPNLNIEADKQTVREIAECLKEMGWTFASHGWGHIGMGADSYEHFVWDADMWQREVASLLGEVDILIYPKGEDIHTFHAYDTDNEKYVYLKSLGFDYFCNVDSNIYWIQKTNDYFRMGRRNFDGRRLWQAVLDPSASLLSDIIPDASTVIDPARPAWE